MARVRVQVPVDQLPSSHLQQTVQPSAATNRFTKTNIIVAAGLLILLFILVSVLQDRNKLKEEVKNLSATSQTGGAAESDRKYHQDVSKMVEVPQGVTPTVKTPTQAELEQLQGRNNLYDSARIGDVFLIYTKPDKNLFIVFYRPTTKKIIFAAEPTQEPSTNAQP